MAPGIYHTYEMTGTNDGTKQVSKDRWNEIHKINEDTLYPRPIFTDVADPTKTVTTNISGAAAAKATTLIFSHTDNRSITFPNATTTLAGLAVAQTFTQTQTFSTVAATQMILNVPTAPAGSASEFIARLSAPSGTVGFITDPQTGDFVGCKFDVATLTNPSAGTVPNAATLKIVGAPVASTNVTITNPYALWVAGGRSLFADHATMYGVFNTQAVLTYGASTAIDFNTNEVLTLALTGDITFTTSNRAAGKNKTIKILCDGTQRAFTFPSWIPVGAALPANIAANKTAILTLMCFGANDTDIVAAFAVQP